MATPGEAGEALNTATTGALEDTYITANCSFVTSTESLFKYGASDVLGVLKNLEIENLEQFNKLIDQENPQTQINGLFKKSIEQIVDNIDDNGSSVVGLQEVNSNGFTNDTIGKALEEKNKYFHILGGVKTVTTNLYTSLGYILPGEVTDYLTVDNGIAEYDEKVGNHAEYNDGFSKNIMAICDLGEENKVTIGNDEINDEIYLCKKYNVDNDKKEYDDGRPISMVVRQKETNPASHIYINCHMLNPSVLKIFDTNTKKLSEESLLQIGKEKQSGYNELTGMDIWYKYCQDRFSKCINELVKKFPNLNIDDNTKIIFFGDFNDSLGYLASKPLKFTIRDKEYYVQIFGNDKKTCCPNTNSAFTKSDKEIDSIIQKKPFGITFSNTNDENIDKIKDELPEHLDNYNNFNNLAFPGDYIGLGLKDGDRNIAKSVSIIEEGGSDHKFLKVVFSATPAKGGKRRRTRRKNKNKNAKKTNKKGKSKKYRKKGRKTRKIRRRK